MKKSRCILSIHALCVIVLLVAGMLCMHAKPHGQSDGATSSRPSMDSVKYVACGDHGGRLLELPEHRTIAVPAFGMSYLSSLN